ncbi:hypothetical protein Aduo_008267 [Ancylostoma duodenale]
MVPLYDASGNRMTFLGAVKVRVEMEGGKKSEVAFHISDVKDDDILLGTNSLNELGVQLTLVPHEIKHSEEVKDKRVVVAKRTYVPPHESALVEARCEGESKVEKRVVWPGRDGSTASVLKVWNQKWDIPILNNGEKPMILQEGEEIARQGTKKWNEFRKDLNPLMTDTATHEIKGEARQRVLQVAQGSKVEQLSEKKKAVPDELPEDRVDMVTSREENWRKPKFKVNKMMVSCSREGVVRPKFEEGHLEHVCKNGGFKGTRSEDLKCNQLRRAVEKMGAYKFEKKHDSALKRQEIELQAAENERRPIKGEPTASAALLKKDGPRRGMEETESKIETGEVSVRSVFRKPVRFTTVRTEDAPVRAMAYDGGSMWRSRYSRRRWSNERPARK